MDNRPPLEEHIAHIENRYGIEWVKEPKAALSKWRDAFQNNE